MRSDPAEGQPAPGPAWTQDFDVRTLGKDLTIELTDGRRARVVDNPQDGMWIVCQFIDDRGFSVGTEPVFCSDVRAVLT